MLLPFFVCFIGSVFKLSKNIKDPSPTSTFKRVRICFAYFSSVQRCKTVKSSAQIMVKVKKSDKL